LLSVIWSFGGVLNRECRKFFEETFGPFKRKFNLTVGGSNRTRFTLFDIFYDPEELAWEML
jgi:hypothetical protein